MPMSEERFPGDLRNGDSSSFTFGLTVAGAVAGLLLLFCGGVAGFVAWKDSGLPSEGSTASPNSPATKNRISPETAQAIVRKIVKIDIPSDFEAIDGDELPPGRRVVFGRKIADGTLLKLRQFDLSNAPPGSDPQSFAPRMMQMTELGDERTNTSFTGEGESSESTRELTVAGKTAVFRFLKGKRSASEKTLWKVTGTFTAGKGFVGLVYTIPEADYNEDAVLRMIESIEPPDSDTAADTDDATSPADKDASESNSGETEESRPAEDAQPQDDETPE